MSESKKKEVQEVFQVITKENYFIREYSTEIHGKDAKKLAEQFAKKKNLIVK